MERGEGEGREVDGPIKPHLLRLSSGIGRNPGPRDKVSGDFKCLITGKSTSLHVTVTCN